MVSLKTAIVELQFFPPPAWFALHFQYEEVKIEAHENYQKGGYRNRCQIATAQGPRWLSVPLKKGKHQKTPTTEVEVRYLEDWQLVHWRTLVAAYAKSPFFDFFAPRFEAFYQEKHPHLWSLNLASVQLVCDCLELEFEPQFTTAFQKTPSGDDWRNLISPRSSQWQEPAFAKAAYYPQVFEDRLGFINNLSILDLLFCLGPNAVDLIEQIDITKTTP